MRSIRIALLIMLALFAVSPAHAFFGMFSKYAEVKAENGLVSIPLADIAEGKAQHYRFAHGGKEVKFFLLKTPDGVVRAAFDACDVCFHSKKGYTQDKDFMICNNCGMRFHSSRIGDVEGGCNPAPLPRSIKDGSVVMSVEDLMTGQRFF